MALEGLSAVQNRIATIERVAGSFSARPASATGFAAELTRALLPGDGATDVQIAPEARGRNGQLADADLAPIGIGSHRLAPAAAEAFRRMRAAAAAEGVEIGVTGAYRDFDGQVDLARRKGLYSNGGLAAVPGTSQHGWGLAVDVDVDVDGQSWLRANASRFGFFEDVPREPWHWEYQHGR